MAVWLLGYRDVDVDEVAAPSPGEGRREGDGERNSADDLHGQTWSRQQAETSCWVRVGQSWSGGKWSMLALPRVGHEVIVAFQDGDPDQPLIVGSPYDFDQSPPVDLPQARAQFARRSKKKLGDEFHGLMFDDSSAAPSAPSRSDGTYHCQAAGDAGHGYGGKFVVLHVSTGVNQEHVPRIKLSLAMPGCYDTTPPRAARAAPAMLLGIREEKLGWLDQIGPWRSKARTRGTALLC